MIVRVEKSKRSYWNSYVILSQATEYGVNMQKSSIMLDTINN